MKFRKIIIMGKGLTVPHEEALSIPDRVASQGDTSYFLRKVHDHAKELSIGLLFDGEV